MLRIIETKNIFKTKTEKGDKVSDNNTGQLINMEIFNEKPFNGSQACWKDMQKACWKI